MKLFGNVNNNTAPACSGRHLPSIEGGLSSVSSLSLNSGAMANRRQNNVPNNGSSGNRRGNLTQLINPAIEKSIMQVIKKKRSEIVDHDENIVKLETLKSEKEIAQQKGQQLNALHALEKNKLKMIRKKRSEAEKLYDRQESINNLGSKTGIAVKARLFFAGKLNETDQILAGARESISKTVLSIEKAAILKNKAVVENEVFINIKRDEIAVLQKAIKSNAAVLYSQVLRIERENKNLFASRTMAVHLKIKNGKYLLIPLLRAGQFRSFGAQLAYQARRIAGPGGELPAPASGAEKRANQWSLYERVEV